MRVFLLLVWLMIPVVGVAYHFGPGQERQAMDDVARSLEAMQRAAAAEQWDDVIAACDAALAKLPKDRVAEGRRIALERAKARMFVKQLPLAHQELEGLVGDLRADENCDPKLLTEAQAALANSQYYMTWLMRLEGKSRDEWDPEIESSRQIYRLLAEQAQQNGDEKLAKTCREDLESAIRLARMDLKDLQGLPLPSQ
jgi:hypothetical protein